MKITVEQKDFAGAIAMASRAIAARTQISVLGCVEITTLGNDKISLYATDCEISISVTCEAMVEEPGRLLVNAATLKRIAENSMGVISISDTTIVSNGMTVQLPEIVEDMPARPERDDKAKKLVAASDSLHEALLGCMYAASRDDTRYILNSVQIATPKQRVIKLTATDGRRLAITECKEGTGHKLAQPVILPIRTAKCLAPILKDAGDANIEMRVSENHCELRVTNVVVTSRLLEGTYPDVQKVIPEELTSSAEIWLNSLTHALESVSIAYGRVKTSDNCVPICTLKLAAYADCATMSAQNMGIDLMQECRCESITDSKWITVNAEYLLQALTASSGGNDLTSVRYSNLSNDAPIQVGDRGTHILMPIRI